MTQPVRLYVKGQILGYKRSKANQYNHTALIKVGVQLLHHQHHRSGRRGAFHCSSTAPITAGAGGRKWCNTQSERGGQGVRGLIRQR